MSKSQQVMAIVVVLSVFAVGVLSLDSCEPDCTGKDSGKVPDPLNCTQYYYCLHGGVPMDEPVPCLAGNVFDPMVNACAPGTSCEPMCICTPHCVVAGIATADPKDCTKYYLCTGEGEPDEAFHYQCEEGNFNITTGLCDPDAPCTTTCPRVKPYSSVH